MQSFSKWLVIFRDDPQMLERRKIYGEQHLEYFAKHSHAIKLAGGLRYAETAPFVGGAWLVEAPTIDKVRTLVENDPYYHGDHRHYEVMFWGIAHNDMAKENENEG